MKRTTLLLLTFCLATQAFSKLKTVPKELQGFWQYKVDKVGNWNGPTVGANYVDYQYNAYNVDSVSVFGDGYKIWLSNANNQINLIFSNVINNTAVLQFSGWKAPKSCTKFETDPDITIYSTNSLPEKYTQKWIVPAIKPSYFSISNGKVNYGNRNWDLVSAGRYMGREDRFLIKNNNDYQILYISDEGKNLRLVNQKLKQIYTPQIRNVAFYKLMGNWIDQETNQWDYGFYENYAIYNSQIWQYKSLNFGKDIIAELTNGKENKKVTIKLLNDTTSQISENNDNHTYYRQTGEFRNTKFQDKKSFYNSQFSKTDTAVITGVLLNASTKEPFSVGVQNPITGEAEDYYADLDSNGFFTVKVPLLNTSQAFLDWKRSGRAVDVIEPGEHYFYFSDQITNLKAVMGKNANFHNELLNYKLFSAFGSTEEDYLALKKMKPKEFLTQKVINAHKSDEIINKYFNQHPNLSSRFKYFVSENARYTLGSDLMQKRFDLDRQNDERFPQGYMEYVNDSLYKQQPPVPLTLIRDFRTFMRDYLDYNGNAQTSITGDEVILKLIEQGQLTLNSEEKIALLAQKAFNDYAGREVKDSVKLTKISKAFNANYQKLARDFYDRNEKLISNKTSELLWVKILEQKLQNADHIKDKSLKEIVKMNAFSDYYESFHKEIHPATFKTLTAMLDNPYLISLINQTQSKYTTLSKVDVEYTESLKKTDHLKDAKNADSLWATLTKPYLGKVIYVDFWGTWCGPCRGEMPYVAGVKEALSGKDVIFMYFANNSPNETWKNMIKEYGLSGENTVQYNLPAAQQKLLERRLTINSFPTYLIIDKEGNVKTMKAPRPSDKDNLVKAISELL